MEARGRRGVAPGLAHGEGGAAFRSCLPPNGTVVANTWADLADGALLAPIEITEQHSAVVGGRTWSNTEGGDAGERAVDRLRHALTRDMIAV